MTALETSVGDFVVIVTNGSASGITTPTNFSEIASKTVTSTTGTSTTQTIRIGIATGTSITYKSATGSRVALNFVLK